MGLRDLTFRKAVTLKDFLPCLSVSREASDTLCQLNAERAGSKNRAFIDAYHDDKSVAREVSDTLCQLSAERAGNKNRAFIDAYHDDKMVTPRLSVE